MPRESAQLPPTAQRTSDPGSSLMDEQDYSRSSEMARSNTPNTSAIADSLHCPFVI